MADDYLWDGQGPVDVDVASFEVRLAGFAHGQLARSAIAPARPRWTGFWIGAAVAVAAVLAIAWALRPDRTRTRHPEPDPSVAPVSRPRSHPQHVRVRRPEVPRPVETEPEAPVLVETVRQRPGRRPRLAPVESVAVPTDRPEGDRIAGQVLAYGRQIRRCFADEREAQAGAFVWMRFEVSRDGTVAKPRLERHNLDHDAMADRIAKCLAAVLRRWRLPASSRDTSIVAPFVNPGGSSP